MRVDNALVPLALAAALVVVVRALNDGRLDQLLRGLRGLGHGGPLCCLGCSGWPRPGDRPIPEEPC
eukprot:2061212-Pyramimonas_sp.AAC.1